MKRSTLFPLLALILLIASLFPITPARAATFKTVRSFLRPSGVKARSASVKEAPPGSAMAWRRR